MSDTLEYLRGLLRGRHPELDAQAVGNRILAAETNQGRRRPSNRGIG